MRTGMKQLSHTADQTNLPNYEWRFREGKIKSLVRAIVEQARRPRLPILKKMTKPLRDIVSKPHAPNTRTAEMLSVEVISAWHFQKAPSGCARLSQECINLRETMAEFPHAERNRRFPNARTRPLPRCGTELHRYARFISP